MKAVVDDKIPYIRQAIESVADEVTYLPGREISRRDVADADVLIVRTRTRAWLAGANDSHGHHRL